MEFTVSRADLVRELNLSQGVVEKKTTIPILSNVLVEADGGPYPPDRYGSGVGDSLLVCGACEENRRGDDPSAAFFSITYVFFPIPMLQVKVADNHWANLVCGRSKTRIAGMSRDSFRNYRRCPKYWRDPDWCHRRDDRKNCIRDFQ